MNDRLPEASSQTEQAIYDDIQSIISWSEQAGFTLTPELNGADGVNRHRGADGKLLPRPNLTVSTDTSAIAHWLASRRNTHTRDAYRKEAMRLLRWAVGVRRKSLSDLVLDDFLAYKDFLKVSATTG